MTSVSRSQLTKQSCSFLESEMLYQAILNVASAAIIVVDHAQDIILFNLQAETVFGYSGKEAIGKSLDFLIPDRFREIHSEHIKKFSTRTDTRIHMSKRPELVGLRKNGDEFPVEIIIAKVEVEGKRYFIGMVQDVSARKQAERTLQKVNQSLRQSNIRLSQLLEAMPVCIYTCEADSTYGVRSMGKSVHKLTGYTPEMFTNSPAFWAEHIHPEDIDRVFGDKQEFFETERNSETYRFQVADGSYIWFHDFTQVIKKSDGRPDYIIGVLADITKQKQAEEKIHYLAYYDDLTGLPNRARLNDHLEKSIQIAKEKNKPLAFLIMDLDRFREINDTLGHHRGDTLLKGVADRLKSVLFVDDVVARMGGDEFAVIAILSKSHHSTILAHKILKVLESPFLIEGLSVSIDISIGIAFFPDHGLNAESLIQHADTAMYIAKNNKRGHVIYESYRDSHDPRKLELMSELRNAIKKDELALHYQPKIDLKTDQVIGLEALLRWKHPERGMIPPDQFIGLAEQTGIIKPLTEWVFNVAYQQCLLLHEKGIKVSIAINISSRNMQDTELQALIEEKIKKSVVDMSALELEITESVIMDNPEGAIKIMNHLKNFGVTFTIDDYGTGYSSLTYLKRLPVSSLKIDRSFVTHMTSNEEDAAIVRSTIDLGHSLGLLVVAEGVEDKSTYESLAAMNCDAAQGYYMCRPIPPDELYIWLDHPVWD